MAACRRLSSLTVAPNSRAHISKRSWPAMNAPRRRGRRQRRGSAPSASGFSAPQTLSLFTTCAATLRSRATSDRSQRATTLWDRRLGPSVHLYDYLSSFLFEIYDTIEHPALGQTPREAYFKGLESTGVRPNRLIPYDQAFLMATLPTTQRGTARVSPGRGVIVNGVYYWAEAFRDPTVENHDVAVRYDPFDIGKAYAFVKNRWTEGHSEHYAALRGRSEKEIMLASKEVRRRSQLHSRERFTLTARKLADFLGSVEAEEKCLLQRLRDRESKSIRQNGPAVVPDAASGREAFKESQSGNATPPISVPGQAEATRGLRRLLMTANHNREPDGTELRLDRFRSFTVAHPRLVEAKETLINAIRGAEPNSLIFVFGPTGVGKTTLRLKTEQLITAELLSELQEDITRVPVVSVEAVAPESGSFNWRDHYKRLLHQLDEPLIDRKLNRQVERAFVEPSMRFMPTFRAVGTEYRYAVEQAIRYRRPVAVMIDEAQHLGKISSGRRLLDQLDVVKSIANQTKTVHVLFGTYDLLAFRNLNGQLSRRSIDVHLARYRAEDSEDRQTFINVVQSFEKELAFEDQSDLVSDWEFLYERSLGCVGILKEWLVRAATVASRKGGRRLTRANLESQALCVAQCEQLYAETTDGELKLNERSEAVARLRGRLGLSTHATTEVDPTRPAPPVKRRRPGQRLPTRDVIGQMDANAAAL